jgi:hypothetical protein
MSGRNDLENNLKKPAERSAGFFLRGGGACGMVGGDEERGIFHAIG